MSSHIRARKHLKANQIATLVTLAFPAAAIAQQPILLPEVKVEAKAETPYKVEKSANPKYTQPLLDTPQTISVISKEIMREQGATSLMEALRNTPGITMQLGENGNTSAGDTFQMRGVTAQTSTFVDGVRDLGAISRDVFNLEQIEVVKGPASGDVGRGGGGGYLNLITKLPGREDFSTGTASWNTGDTKRVSVDLNKTLNDTTAVRLNAMTLDGGVDGRNVVNNKSIAIAPSIAFGLGTSTRLYLYTSHVRQDNVPDGGVSTIGMEGYYNATAAIRSGSRVNRENFYGSTTDYEKVNSDMVTAKLEHDFGNGTVIRNTTRYGATQMDRSLTAGGTINGANTAATAVNPAVLAADPSTWLISRNRQRVDQSNEIFTNQTNLTTQMKTGQVTHDISTGVEFIYERQKAASFTSPTAATIASANLYNPNSNVVLPDPTRSGYTNGAVGTVAVYANDAIKFSERWQVHAGARAESYQMRTQSGTASLKSSDTLYSWKLGAVYKPASNGSIYASVSNAAQPPGGANFSLNAAANNIANPNMDPTEYKNAEIGTKWDLLNKKLNLTTALYQTVIKNELTQADPLDPTSFFATGKRTVEGVELGVVGNLTDNWQLSAGLQTMKTTVANNASNNSARWAPDLTATLWTTYTLGNWSVGGGARYMSEQKRVVDPAAVVATSNMPSIPEYWVFDAMASYKVSRNTSVRLNVYNLTDKFYINSLVNSGLRATLGAPLSAMLSASFQF